MEFNEDGTLDISMIKYLKNVINEFPEIIKGRAATPAHEKLFVIRDENEARPLKEDQALAFHHGYAGKTRHTNSSSIPNDKSEEP